MSTAKNTVIALLVLTTVGGAVLSWRQYQELLELRASALSAAERADLQKKIWDLQKSNRELNDKLAAKSDQPGRGEGDPAAELTNAPEENPRAGGPRGRFQQFAAMREFMQKPEVQAMVRTAEKGLIDARYGSLFRNLNLSPEQQDKLTGLLLERQSALQDVYAAARDQGVNPRTDPEGFKKLVADAENSINDNIKSTLGDSGYSQFTNYEQTMPQRNLVNVLQARLASGDTPLTSAQSEQLVQILAANAPQSSAPAAGAGMMRGGGDFGGGGGRIGAVMGGGGTGAAALVGPGAAQITPAAMSQSGTVLNSAQLSTLEQLQQQQQNAQQLQQMLRNTLQQAAPANNNGGTTGTTGGKKRGGG